MRSSDCSRLFSFSHWSTMGRGSFDEIGSRRVRLELFSCLVLTSQVIGVVAIILLAILFGQYRGGFAWTVSSFAMLFQARLLLSVGHRQRIQLSSIVHDAGHDLLLR